MFQVFILFKRSMRSRISLLCDAAGLRYTLKEYKLLFSSYFALTVVASPREMSVLRLRALVYLQGSRLKLDNSVSISSRSSMSTSVLSLLMVVIDRAGTCSSARADERTFPATDQRPSPRSYGCTNAYALCGLLFSGLRVPITPALAACNGNRQREREHQQ